ncbi:MAG: hypothetical protein EOM03_09590 [Clostridia bacterium]|nr:hypothetical protein [Clostridia bacterium]
MLQKVIEIPGQFSPPQMFQFFREILDAETLEPLYEEIILDFRNLSFIKPTGVAALSNASELLIKRGCSLRFRFSDEMQYRKTCPISYLDDSGFFNKYLGRKLFPYSSCRETTLPLKNLGIAEWYEWVERILSPWIDRRINSDINEQFPELKACFWEIRNNVLDHSGEEIASIFLQHYPRDDNGRIEIGISDFGVGIPYNVAKKCECDTHAKAIYTAIQDGFSTKSNPGNRGAGLGILIDNVTKNNGGSVNIYSYKGQLSCIGRDGHTRYQGHDIDFYPGTLIKIVINTDTIVANELRHREDLLW